MFYSYIKIALRNLQKNKLYAAINIVGLAAGLCMFLLSFILINHEYSFDQMFKNHQRIFFVNSIFSPTANIGFAETDAIHTAVTPHLRTDIVDLEAIARSKRDEFLMTVGNNSFYEEIRFADYSLMDIFDFTYITGNAQAFKNPNSIFLTRDTANKLFGSTDVIGKTVSLDHKHVLQVGAVIENPPQDSHFSTWPLDEPPLGAIAPLVVLERASDYVADNDWADMSTGDLTYVLIPANKDQQWLQQQVDGVYQRHFSDDHKRFISGLGVRRLDEVNTMLWNMIGIPALKGVQLLGVLILIIACVNYTNLTTAQNLGRLSEVGLRKTFGASRRQLLTQFLIESITLVLLSSVLAVAFVELILPLYNSAMDRQVSLNYLAIMPMLLTLAIVVGCSAGAYPAYQIIRGNTIDALKNKQNNSSVLIRNIMVASQFVISTIMLVFVIAIILQNAKVEESKLIYPIDQLVLLNDVQEQDIQPLHQTLKDQLLRLDGVKEVSYVSQAPFRQSDSSWPVTTVKGDANHRMQISNIVIDHDFLPTFDIDLVAGRNFDTEHAQDNYVRDAKRSNVIINEMSVQKMGFASASDAVGKSIYRSPANSSTQDNDTEFHIIGVMADRNFKGLHNRIKPYMFFNSTLGYRTAAVRISSDDIPKTLASIDKVWKEVIPDYPIQRQFQDELFEDVFKVMRTVGNVATGFAVIAMTLALVGLFGLAAFMAERRTKEIGIRKTLGASTTQIMRLLIWQFSIPVMWAILVAIPIAYFATNIYLNFFADRINNITLVLFVSAVTAIVMAWLITAVHAYRVAKRSPILALRHE